MSVNIEEISLTELVDLSIGTPEKGAINFNLLKCILKVLTNRILEEDNTLSVAFRGSSADIVRNLRESSSQSSQSLEMELVSNRPLDTGKEVKQTCIELNGAKLDIGHLNDCTDNMANLRLESPNIEAVDKVAQVCKKPFRETFGYTLKQSVECYVIHKVMNTPRIETVKTPKKKIDINSPMSLKKESTTVNNNKEIHKAKDYDLISQKRDENLDKKLNSPSVGLTKESEEDRRKNSKTATPNQTTDDPQDVVVKAAATRRSENETDRTQRKALDSDETQIRPGDRVPQAPLVRPPGRCGARPKQNEALPKEDRNSMSNTRDIPSGFTIGGRTPKIEFLHINPNYTEKSSVAVVQGDLEQYYQSGINTKMNDSGTSNESEWMNYEYEGMDHDAMSVDGTPFHPKWKMYFDLKRAVSNILTETMQEPPERFKKWTGDALNIIKYLLKELLDADAKPEPVCTFEVDNTLVTSLQNRIDSLESEILRINNVMREAKHDEKRQHPTSSLAKKVFNSIKQLQSEIQEVHRKLGTNDVMMNDSKMCLQSLYKFIEDMDKRKVDMKQLNLINKDILERSRMDGKVDLGEFRSEVKRLGENIAEANEKHELQKKFQMLQCDVTNKIFEMLPSMIEKEEYEDLTNAKVNTAMSKLEAQLKRLERKPNAAGAKRSGVQRDLLCLSCNNEVEMGETSPFYHHQNKSVRANKIYKPRNPKRYCPAPSGLTQAQKMALGKRYPWSPYGEVLPPHISVIAKQYLGEDSTKREQMKFLSEHTSNRWRTAFDSFHC